MEKQVIKKRRETWTTLAHVTPHQLYILNFPPGPNNVGRPDIFSLGIMRSFIEVMTASNQYSIT